MLRELIRVVLVGLLLAAPVAAAPASPGSNATGANVEESGVAATITVGEGAEYPSLTAALPAISENLRQGVATRVRVLPGVYREGEIMIDGVAIGGAAEATLLIIEAAEPRQAIFSGSEVFTDWQAVRDDAGQVLYYEHPWEHDFGLYPGGWGSRVTNQTAEHRRHLVMVNGFPLSMAEVEQYDFQRPRSGWNKDTPDLPKTDAWTGIPQDVAQFGVYTYTGMVDPKTLPAGSFGFYERPENGDRVVIRLPEGVEMADATIEVGVRPWLLRIQNKSNVVLRGLVFEQSVGELGWRGDAVTLGAWGREWRGSDYLVDNCEFRWNAGTGLGARFLRDLTVINSDTHHNLYSGLNVTQIDNMLVRDMNSDFNNWRIAGRWAGGASKVHQLVNARFHRYRAFGGRQGQGLWFDLWCRDILVDESVLLAQSTGTTIETSWDIVYDRCVIAGSVSTDFRWLNSDRFTMTRTILGGANWGSQIQIGAEDRTVDIATNPERSLRIQSEVYGEPWRQTPLEFEDTRMIGNVIAAYPDNDPADDAAGFLVAFWRGDREQYRDIITKQVEWEDNVWWSPLEEPFGFDVEDRKTQQYKIITDTIGFSEWQQMTDPDARWHKPEFRDPQNFDFRLPADSPLKAMGLYEYVVPAELLKEHERMQAFHAVVGVKATPVTDEDAAAPQ